MKGAIVELFDEHQIDLVCLVLYENRRSNLQLMKAVSLIFTSAYLPEFPGAHGIEDA